MKKLYVMKCKNRIVATYTNKKKAYSDLYWEKGWPTLVGGEEAKYLKIIEKVL